MCRYITKRYSCGCEIRTNELVECHKNWSEECTLEGKALGPVIKNQGTRCDACRLKEPTYGKKKSGKKAKKVEKQPAQAPAKEKKGGYDEWTITEL